MNNLNRYVLFADHPVLTRIDERDICYDKALNLRTTLNSLNYVNIEIRLINDGSNATKTIVKFLGDI